MVHLEMSLVYTRNCLSSECMTMKLILRTNTIGYLGRGIFDFSESVKAVFFSSVESNLFGMFLIIKTKTPNSFYVLRSQRGEEKADISNLISDIVFPEDLASNNLGLFCFRDVCHTLRKYSISVISLPVPS